MQDKDSNKLVTLEDNKLIVQNLTWNVEGFTPTKLEQVTGLFAPVIEYRPHMIVIGLEEVFEMKLNNFTKILANSSMPEEAKTWEKMLTLALRQIDETYSHLSTEVNGGVMVVIYTCLPVKDFQIKKAVKTNLGSIGGMFANKGAVTLNVTYRKARMQFIACHLESGEGDKPNVERVSQLQSIAPSAIDNGSIDEPKKKVFLSNSSLEHPLLAEGCSRVYWVSRKTLQSTPKNSFRSFWLSWAT